jgi:hypothetical protein
MVNPTNVERLHFAPRGRQDVWTSPGPPWYLESIQAAGSVAAPLLAGASFTLVALVLQSTTPFGRWQDLALLLLVAAGLAQVFAVQSVIWTRRYMVTPDDLRQWYPDDFNDPGERPTRWLLNVQGINNQLAEKWADRTRRWMNAGISLLLAGIAVGVVPAGHISGVRWAVITVAWAGLAVEASWVLAIAVDGPARPGMMLRAAAIFTSGGATAAAGFAATAGTPDGAPATWWAVALAVAAIPFWLAAHTGARLSHGRVRIRSRPTGMGSIAQVALALLAPAVFILAWRSVFRALAANRRRGLCERHEGVEQCLPDGVTLAAHDRAWSRCFGIPVDTEKELAGLLQQSEQCLGQVGQPPLAELWRQLTHSPGCVVKVVDRDSAETVFGYLVVYPLLAETVRRIRSGQLTAVRQFGPADLAATPADAVGWYIAVMWAPGPRWTRQCVIATLVDALAACAAGSADRPVFARPATAEGRALMESYRFAAITAQDNGIWALETCAADVSRPPRPGRPAPWRSASSRRSR